MPRTSKRPFINDLFMKPYKDQNYYEILDIQTDASPFEIRHAFQETFELYQSDSTVSYSFFSEEERKEILCRLEEAYLHLIDAKSRHAYDQILVENGFMEEGKQFQDKSKAPIPIYQSMNRHIGHTQSALQLNSDRPQAAQLVAVQELLEKDILTGHDLRTIRLAKGVALDKIENESKIKISMLQAIEDDDYERLPPLAYLKGFIKLYAQCLQIDDNIVVSAYIQHLKN